MEPRPQDAIEAAIPSLAEAQRRLTRERILTAARAMIAQHGLSATVEEIAAAAGVSARTVFRHFSTHDLLLSETLNRVYQEIWQPVDGLPDPDADLEAFVGTLTRLSHTRNAQMLGRAFWDLLSPSSHAPRVVAEGLEARRKGRQGLMGQIVSQAWRSAGGTGPPPEHLVEAFWLHFSAFTTFSYAADFDFTPEQTAASSAAILLSLLRGSVAEQRAADPGAGTAG